MWRQDARPDRTGPPLAERRHRSERLRVKDHRHWRGLCVRHGQEHPHQLGRGESRSQPGSHDDGVVLVVEDAGNRRLRVNLLDVVLRQGHCRGLDDLRGEQWLERFRDRERHEPRARATRRATDKERRTGVVHRARDDEDLAEGPLVAARRPLREQGRGRLVVHRLGTIIDGVLWVHRLVPPKPQRPSLRHDPAPTRPSFASAPCARGFAARDRPAVPRCPAGTGTDRPQCGSRTRPRPRIPPRA